MRHQKHGQELPHTKLTPALVAEIRASYQRRAPGQGGNSVTLARRYGITSQQVRNIARGRQWRWLA